MTNEAEGKKQKGAYSTKRADMHDEYNFLAYLLSKTIECSENWMEGAKKQRLELMAHICLEKKADWSGIIFDRIKEAIVEFQASDAKPLRFANFICLILREQGIPLNEDYPYNLTHKLVDVVSVAKTLKRTEEERAITKRYDRISKREIEGLFCVPALGTHGEVVKKKPAPKKKSIVQKTPELNVDVPADPQMSAESSGSQLRDQNESSSSSPVNLDQFIISPRQKIAIADDEVLETSLETKTEQMDMGAEAERRLQERMVEIAKDTPMDQAGHGAEAAEMDSGVPAGHPDEIKAKIVAEIASPFAKGLRLS